MFTTAYLLLLTLAYGSYGLNNASFRMIAHADLSSAFHKCIYIAEL
jgi:hypothetical protein